MDLSIPLPRCFYRPLVRRHSEKTPQPTPVHLYPPSLLPSTQHLSTPLLKHRLGFAKGLQASATARTIDRYRLMHRRLSKTDWRHFYAREDEVRPVDAELIQTLGASSAFGHRQKCIPLEHRNNIVRWMAEACQATQWSSASFYTAVYAFDSYLLKTRKALEADELGPLSAACLFFGAQLKESTTDNNLLTLSQFRSLCPEIGSSHTVREQEAHVLDVLQGQSIGNRTPYDISVIWLANLGSSYTFHQLYIALVTSRSLEVLHECLIQISNIFFINGFSTLIPCTAWMATSLAFFVLALTSLTLDHCLHAFCEEIRYAFFLEGALP